LASLIASLPLIRTSLIRTFFPLRTSITSSTLFSISVSFVFVITASAFMKALVHIVPADGAAGVAQERFVHLLPTRPVAVARAACPHRSW
jgi:hypothetical protein